MIIQGGNTVVNTQTIVGVQVLELPLLNELQSYWKLDEESIGETVVDSHGSANGTLDAGDNGGWQTGGILGNKFIRNVNDVDDIGISVGNVHNVSVGSPFSVNFWTYHTQALNQSYMSKYTDVGGSKNGWKISSSSSGTVSFRIFGSTSAELAHYTTVTPLSTLNTWHMVTVTWSGINNPDEIKIYVDGSLQTKNLEVDTLTGVTTSTIPLRLTVDYSVNNSQSLSRLRYGSMDEVGIWYRELSQKNITDLYNSGNALAYPFT